jgi:kexin
MVFWGSTIDPSRAVKYELANVDDVLPPVPIHKPVLPPASTKQHSKPTAPLPHAGEKTSVFAPAGSSPTTTVPDTPATTPTPNPPSLDEPWFPNIDGANQKWFIGAVGAVAIFGLGATAFFWRRRQARRSAEYSALNENEELSMTGIGGLTAGARTTRELYDAFGEVSDDEDDETSALRPAQHQSRGINRLGYHSGFLDDDEPSSAGPAATTYRDEPPQRAPSTQHTEASPEVSAPASPSESGSSWEHATVPPPNAS